MYFKTKNYSSFVRQLNMYDFHKVKNHDGRIEFSHPDITRDHRPNIDSFHRRATGDNNAPNKIEKEKTKSYINEVAKIRHAQAELEESMVTLVGQTESLIAINKELITKIYEEKRSADIHIRKLLLIYLAMLANSDPEVFNNFRKHNLIGPGSKGGPGGGLNLENIESFIRNASRKILFSNDFNALTFNNILQTVPGMKGITNYTQAFSGLYEEPARGGSGDWLRPDASAEQLHKDWSPLDQDSMEILSGLNDKPEWQSDSFSQKMNEDYAKLLIDTVARQGSFSGLGGDQSSVDSKSEFGLSKN